MLVYTDDSKEMIYRLLREAGYWGQYSERFINELHKKLSIIHLREDKIFITWIDFRCNPNHTEKTVKFSCEISLKWENGIVGGMVWHEHTQTFGLHS